MSGSDGVERVPVVVIGGGAAGLATAATLKRRGIACVVLDRSDRIGDSWATRYDRLRLHTHRALSGLPYRRIPRRLGRYLTKQQFADYLAGYAEALELDVRLACRVASVTPTGDGGWCVRGTGREFEARAVVVATGLFGVPARPDIDGAQAFAGTLLHASEYRSGADFAGQRVLVVGIGNTGAELAADLVEQGAADVSIAVRTVPPITKRDVFGVSSQVIGLAIGALPTRIADGIVAAVRKAGPDLAPWGLATPGWQTFASGRPPVIDVGFVEVLLADAIDVRPAVQRLTAEGAVFTDGSYDDYDAVVLATGYDPGLSELLAGAPGALDAHGMPAPDTGRGGLFFIGFRLSLRGLLLEIRRSSRRQARTIAAYLGDGGA